MPRKGQEELLNDNQLNFIAEILKIIAVGQFGYFGYNALEKTNHLSLSLSALVFIYLIIGAVLILGKVEDKQ